jgi:hypothetical protein
VLHQEKLSRVFAKSQRRRGVLFLARNRSWRLRHVKVVANLNLKYGES